MLNTNSMTTGNKFDKNEIKTGEYYWFFLCLCVCSMFVSRTERTSTWLVWAILTASSALTQNRHEWTQNTDIIYIWYWMKQNASGERIDLILFKRCWHQFHISRSHRHQQRAKKNKNWIHFNIHNSRFWFSIKVRVKYRPLEPNRIHHDDNNNNKNQN